MSCCKVVFVCLFSNNIDMPHKQSIVVSLYFLYFRNKTKKNSSKRMIDMNRIFLTDFLNLFFFSLHMILLPFAFLNETLPQELPWQVWCSFSLSSLPFYASYPNVEDARICLRLDPPFIVVPIPILLIHIAAKPINGDDYLRAERTLSALVCAHAHNSQRLFFMFQEV